MITALKNENYNHCHLWHSKFSFLLSETVDSTSSHGKREWYGSFLINKSKLNGKGCGFDCTICQTGFWFANLKTGWFTSWCFLILQHLWNLYFFPLFKSITFWATSNIAKLTAPNLHSKAEGSRDWDLAQPPTISGHSFLANSPSQPFISALFTYFPVFQLSHSKQLPT